ncbi:response regulator transcription factor [Mollicutes bacterium LVI A0039]|nr:response regulator transcription factor [Mollicutes bacterium LVI A0039]
MIKVLFVEDDPDYAEYFIKYMASKSIEVIHINQLDMNKITEATKESPNVIVLDFFLGSEDTSNAFAALKNTGIPIIYLTSNDNLQTEATLLKQGAEDYISKLKPLEIIETKITKLACGLKPHYSFWGNTLDMETKKINDEVKLTDNEYQIMIALIKGNSQHVAVETLMLSIWNEDLFIERNTLVVAIKRLREKLRKHQINAMISSEKGKGYALYEI